MTDIIPQTKVCTKCGKELPLEDFPKMKANRDGRRNICKPCTNKALREYCQTRHDVELPPGYTKTCSKCGQVKPSTEFHKSQMSRDRLGSQCKSCLHQTYLERKAKPITPITEKRCGRCGEVFPADNFNANPIGLGGLGSFCRECRQISHAEYISANKERIRATMRQWYEENKEREREKRREYYRKNLDNAYRRARNRRARLSESDGSHTMAELREILALQDSKCLYCGCDLNGNKHLDHFIPLGRGGTNSKENLAYACPECNLSKHKRLPYDWQGWNGAVPVFWEWKLL